METITFSDIENTEYGHALTEAARQLTLDFNLFENLSSSEWDSLIETLAERMHDAAMSTISE